MPKEKMINYIVLHIYNNEENKGYTFDDRIQAIDFYERLKTDYPNDFVEIYMRMV